MNVEATFNEFVEEFGGELISKLLEGKSDRPSNADYFFRNRTIVAELKCLEKNYFNDRKIGQKVTAIANRWVREGLLRPEHFKGGRFQTNDLPHQCGAEIFKVFKAPVREAIRKANKQIKETKKYFDVPDAKGLLILANDGNNSINPDLMMRILGNVLASDFTAIDSFIFFTPNMRAYTPHIDRQFRVWFSGPVRDSGRAIEPEFLCNVQDGWLDFLERRTGETVTRFDVDDHSIVDQIKLVR